MKQGLTAYLDPRATIGVQGVDLLDLRPTGMDVVKTMSCLGDWDM